MFSHTPAQLRRHRAPRAVALAAAVATLSLTLVGTAPSFANDAPPATPPATDALPSTGDPTGPGGIIFGDLPPAQLEAALEVTGWPDGPIIAGESFTLDLQVDAQILGAPSVEGLIVGMGYNNEILALAALDSTGHAAITLRPVTVGALTLTPLFLGDDDSDYAPVIADSATVTVNAVPTIVELELDSAPDTGEAFVYGGGFVTAYAQVLSLCAADAIADDDNTAAAQCDGLYGHPSGTLQLMYAGDVVAEATVVGTPASGDFTHPDDDLSSADADGFVIFDTGAPEILLGSPEYLDYEAVFTPDNWFSAASDESSAALIAAPTSVDVFAGDDPITNPEHSINGTTITLAAIVGYDNSRAQDVTGNIIFWANGEPISPALPLEDGDAALFTWQPEQGSGTYIVTAEFVPATLNHHASVSVPYSVSLVVPPPPNPTPTDPTDDPTPAPTSAPAADTDGNNSTNTLARTGSEIPAAMGMAAVLLLLLGSATVLVTRRRAH